jgi:ferritin-like metal-binding protein YciE
MRQSGVAERLTPIHDPTEGTMADLNERDTKLVQYLNEAFGKEKELETALQAHIEMTTRAPYKKRLQQHLKETRGHARDVEQRIKKLGGATTQVAALQSAAAKALAAAKGPLHMMRGTGEDEKLLKNAKTEYSEEAEEIATYSAIEALAESVGDRETAKLARSIRRDEERMAKYLERLIPQLTKAVARSEVPSKQRSGRRSSSRRRRSSTAKSRTSGTRSTRSRARAGSRS